MLLLLLEKKHTNREKKHTNSLFLGNKNTNRSIKTEVSRVLKAATWAAVTLLILGGRNRETEKYKVNKKY